MSLSETLWNSEEIAEATGGKATAIFEVNGISIDTRTLEKGDLFVPLKDVRDGHDFIDTAINHGAAGTLSERLGDAPAVIVEDTLEALRSMGRARVSGADVTRIAVTGSVGKTSVKEALAHMFSKVGKTHKSLKSYNNHWGVPLTMACMPWDAEYAVFEMGMNHAGELSDLSTLAAPDIALITTVVAVHLEHFGSVEAIADAKAEIIDGLAKAGTLILNGDNEHTPRIKAKAKPGQTVITFGEGSDCDVQIVSFNCHAFGSNVRVRIDMQQYDVTLYIPGQHWVYNAAACMAVAHAAGINLRGAARALRGVQAEAGRGEMHDVEVDGKSITLLDESYNANPTSMRAAINVLALKEGRKIAVLGDMGELGEGEIEFHIGLDEVLGAQNIDRVITVGTLMRHLHDVLPSAMRGPWAAKAADLVDVLKSELQNNDVVLLKASNSVGLGAIVKDIKEGRL